MSANPWKTSTHLVDRRSGWARHRRWVLVLAILVAAGGATAGYLLLRTPAAPDPATLEPEQLVQYMASPAFAEQSDAVKQKYFQALRPGRGGEERGRSGQPTTRRTDGADANDAQRRADFRRMRAFMRADLTEDQRRQLMENMRPMFEQRMRERMQEFAQLEGEQRTAYLDEIIDRWANRPPRPPRPEGQRSGRQRDGNDRRRHSGRRGFTPDRLRAMIEHAPADVRALHMEFRKALRQRMQERGIEPRRPGR